MPDLTAGLVVDIMGCSSSRATECYPAMIAGMRQFSINEPAEIACFLAQVKWESGGLRYFEELASGAAYEGRLDLGNTQQGDGVKFKGHGPIQVTGRDNHTRAAAATGLDLVNHPELAATVKFGFEISCWWWAFDQFSTPATNCNKVAEMLGNIACGRAVNRGNPYSSTPAQDEPQRIAAYARVRSVGTITLPGWTGVSTAKQTSTNVHGPRGPHGYPGWYMTQGTSGSNIAAFQRQVGLTADGAFGPQTLAYVKALQHVNGLTETGILGIKTWVAAWEGKRP